MLSHIPSANQRGYASPMDNRITILAIYCALFAATSSHVHAADDANPNRQPREAE